MRIVSWNIRAGGGKRIEGIGSQLLSWQADIIALSEFRGTEASTQLAQTLKSQGYIHQRQTTDPQQPAVNSLLVASRWPLRTIKLRHAPDNPRRWLHVNVNGPEALAIMAVHVPNRVTGLKYPFLESVTDVVKNWRGPPAVLLGDTNSGCIKTDEESPAFNRIEDQWLRSLDALGWKDAFRHMHGNTREFTWYSPNGRNGFRLDQIYLHPALHTRIDSFEHCWGGQPHNNREILSDHAAMLLAIKQ